MDFSENWYDEFFFNGWDVIQDDFISPERTSAEIDFIDNFAKSRNYKKILDIPCGTGRVSIDLAKRGYNITGIDFNPNAVSKAKERCNIPNAVWIEGDMREINYENQFDLVISMWGSLGYFTDEENIKFFHSVSKALTDKGAFIFDTNTLETISRKFQPSGINRINDNFILEERTLDLVNSRINAVWSFINSSGKRFERKSSIRLYSYKELLDILKKAGFKEFRAYGGFNGETYNIYSDRLELIAIK